MVIVSLSIVNNEQSAASNNRSSSTIENIAIEKYYSEEVSRVGEIRSAKHCLYGNSIYSEDIV